MKNETQDDEKMVRTTIMLTVRMRNDLIEIAGAQSDMSKQLRAGVAHWIQLRKKRAPTNDKSL